MHLVSVILVLGVKSEQMGELIIVFTLCFWAHREIIFEFSAQQYLHWLKNHTIFYCVRCDTANHMLALKNNKPLDPF